MPKKYRIWTQFQNICKYHTFAFYFYKHISFLVKYLKVRTISSMKKLLSLIFLILFSCFSVLAQESMTDSLQSLSEKIKTLEEKQKRLEHTYNFFSHFGISGGIQAQYQYGEEYSELKVGSPNENYGEETFNRIGIRRGRLKFFYDDKYAQGAFQLNLTEKGINIVDLYMQVKDAWLNSKSYLRAGIMAPCFGFEVQYSSLLRETPENSAVMQTLFPGERDLGAMLALQMPSSNSLSFLKLDMGVFSGNLVNKDIDSRKDFIGRLSAAKSFETDGFSGNWGVGFSYYNGSVFSPTKYKYTMEGNAFILDSTGQRGDYMKREYWGFDAQFAFKWLLGKTTLRCEYTWGTQPGSATSSKSQSYSEVPANDPKYNLYLRPFCGYYFYFLQDILSTPFTFLLKYDYYDPNIKVSGSEIGLSNFTTATDIAYSTWGVGGLWKINKSLYLQLYYEFIANEKTENLTTDTKPDYSTDLKDNVLTLRLQYKF